jgi:hypothetical protein
MMNKTPAQVLRESMDLINSVTTPQVVDEAAEPDYQFEYTITNPFFDMEDENSPEEIDVGVRASIFGKDRPATFDAPAEYAEVELEAVYDLENGQDIIKQVSDRDIERLKQKAREYFDEKADEAAIDRYEMSRDDY